MDSEYRLCGNRLCIARGLHGRSLRRGRLELRRGEGIFFPTRNYRLYLKEQIAKTTGSENWSVVFLGFVKDEALVDVGYRKYNDEHVFFRPMRDTIEDWWNNRANGLRPLRTPSAVGMSDRPSSEAGAHPSWRATELAAQIMHDDREVLLALASIQTTDDAEGQIATAREIMDRRSAVLDVLADTPGQGG
jgi:hypothetical protein